MLVRADDPGNQQQFKLVWLEGLTQLLLFHSGLSVCGFPVLARSLASSHKLICSEDAVSTAEGGKLGPGGHVWPVGLLDAARRAFSTQKRVVSLVG